MSPMQPRGLLLLLIFSGCCAAAGVRGEGGANEAVTELLSRAESDGVITTEQREELLSLAVQLRREGEKERERGEPEEEEAATSVFMRMYDHLTLLNVLYFGGALLIMGAYTLLMTLAWEQYGGWGLGSLLLLQTVLLGAVGVTLWRDSADYQMVGGLLCTISTSMVPFTVYNLQRALKLWPLEDPGLFQDFRVYVRGGWVVMEVATVLVGCGYLSVVRFPFLVSPVAFALWFLSMDLAPFFPAWYSGWWGLTELRRQLSLILGVLMILAGYAAERSLGSHPDFGFWLYLFGLIAFWTSLSLDFPIQDTSASAYLLTCVCLGLLGSTLQRTTFHVFATMGVCVYVSCVLSNRTRVGKSVPLWLLKALVAAALLAQAAAEGGNIEVLGALVCLLAFNFNSVAFLGSGEIYYILLLLTNLGFVACAPLFERPLDLWLITIPDISFPLAVLMASPVAVFHMGLLQHKLPDSPHPMTDFAYHIYRVAASVFISYVFVFLRQPSLAWVGGLGVLAVAAGFSLFARKSQRTYGGRAWKHHLVACLLLVFSVAFSLHLQSRLLYLLSCLGLLACTLAFLNAQWKPVGAALSVALILLAVPLQSKFLVAIGGMYLFAYLSYLAYEVFKNSLLFPLALISLGVFIIYAGIKLQQREEAIHAAFEDHLPTFLSVLLHHTAQSMWAPEGRLDWYDALARTELSLEGTRQAPFNWLLWPAVLVHGLVQGHAHFLSGLCGSVLLALLLALAVGRLREGLATDLSGSVKVSMVTFSLSQRHDSHGLIAELKGEKPADCSLHKYIALKVDGESFWRVAGQTFGEWTVGVARSMFLPYRLSPHLISFNGFSAGSNSFTATVLLGTGHSGSHRLSHATLLSALNRIADSSPSTELGLSLLSARAWYLPYGTLCQTSISLGALRQALTR